MEKMTAIERWLDGELCSLEPTRVDVIPVAECNLKCLHCLWPHGVCSPKGENSWEGQIAQIASWGAPVNYAGRTLAKRGERLIQDCFERNIPVGIIDNGYTILRREDFLPAYTHINISLDGGPEAHDRQRGKVGAFDAAWSTILRLKSLGYDPVVSTAFSPFSFDGWSELETLLRDNDVPMSVALVLAFPETARRGLATFASDKLVKKGFETLLEGIPKLISLYDLEFVWTLRDSLKEFSWSPSDAGDSLTTVTPNGSVIHYYPDSIVAASHAVLYWDGEFYLSWGKNLLKMSEFSLAHKEQVNALNRQELELWNSMGVRGSARRGIRMPE